MLCAIFEWPDQAFNSGKILDRKGFRGVRALRNLFYDSRISNPFFSLFRPFRVDPSPPFCPSNLSGGKELPGSSRNILFLLFAQPFRTGCSKFRNFFFSKAASSNEFAFCSPNNNSHLLLTPLMINREPRLCFSCVKFFLILQRTANDEGKCEGKGRRAIGHDRRKIHREPQTT